MVRKSDYNQKLLDKAILDMAKNNMKNTSLINLQELMKQMIKDANNDLKSPPESQEYKDAYDWFTKNNGYPISFEKACGVLDCNPDYLRGKIFIKLDLS